MKYFTELSKMEDQIIRLETLCSTMRAIACGIESVSEEDASNSIWYIIGSIEDIHEKMQSEFNKLWEKDAEAELKKDKKK
jgi:hypothetical protein